MIFWIFIIVIIGGIGCAIYGEYKSAKYSDEEDAIQKFWRNFAIFIVIILAVCAFFGYKYVNKSHTHHYYHNSNTGREQIQYQGSQEQQQDLKAIDDYSSKHKDF